MAKGGTGDVLTGIIAAFVARFVALKCEKNDFLNFICNAVFVHGYAADLLSKGAKSKQSVSATDVVENLNNVFLKLDRENFNSN